MKWKTLSSEYIYKDNWFTARKDRCERPDGKIIDPYYVLEYNDWATAFPMTADGKILLIKQYRHALGEVGIELPGGCIDPADATPEDAIRRELLEETGYAFESVHYLGRTSSNPSTNANIMHMFVATGGRKVQQQELDHNEEIEILELTIEEIYQLLEKQGVVQSMHVCTIFYALRHLEKIKYEV